MMAKAFPSLCLLVTCALSLPVLAPPLRADTVTLKSGEEYQGKILKETDSEIVMNVKISGGVSDQMTFEKSKVRAVVKPLPDNTAYARLKPFAPGSASFSLARYDQSIAAYGEFLKAFPESGHAQEAKAEIEALKEEKARVARKEIKWNNRWYTAEEAEANEYQIEAEKLLAEARGLAERRDYVGALNTCDFLERTYKGTRAYPEGIELALSVIAKLNGEMKRMVPITRLREQEFKENINFVVEPKKTAMIRAHDAALAKAEAAVASSKEKWKPFVPISDKSIAALEKTISTEYARLQKIELAPMQKSIALAEAARGKIADNDTATAAANLDEANQLWPANEMLTRLIPALQALKPDWKPAPAPPSGSGRAKERGRAR